MTDNIVLRATGIGKRFKLYQTPWHRALEWVSLGRRSAHADFWAVRNISFEIERGDCFGIIGVNGAGKSTLLKLITGVLPTTEGTYQVKGRLLSLLELGIGMNERLTGRENVIASTQLLAFPERYAEQRMSHILEFSELGPFFERPVATYSTGMRMRLAFSLFAFLECDILILDEVMAVGDIFFQQKCYARLSELMAQKTAIILVSHDLNAIQQYCRDVMVLHEGVKLFQGRSDEAIRAYVQARGSRTTKTIGMTVKPGLSDHQELYKFKTGLATFMWPPDEFFFPLPPSAQALGRYGQLIRVSLCDRWGQPTQAFKQGEIAVFCYEFILKEEIGVPIGSLEITTPYNQLLHSKTSLQHQMEAPAGVRAGTLLRFRQSVQMNLAPGDYVFSLGLLAIYPDLYANLEAVSQEELNAKTVWACRVTQAGAFVVTAGLGRGLAVLHGGLCDLPGDCQLQLFNNEPEVSYEPIELHAG